MGLLFINQYLVWSICHKSVPPNYLSVYLLLVLFLWKILSDRSTINIHRRGDLA